MNDTSELERQMKDALNQIQSQIEDLENTIKEIEKKIDESASHLKNLKSGI